ncbi:MAG: HAMP domain-containing protein [Chlorobi bacterium]|nr:HAMP domain-containing protein [Chlorobiota bacterium]
MFQKIRAKLIGVIAITAMIIVGVFSYYQTNSEKEALFNIVKYNGNQLSEIIKMSLHNHMLQNQRERIYEVINRIGNSGEGVKKIRILNKSGEVIYSSNADEIGSSVDMKDENCYACHAENKPLEKLPILNRTRIFKTETDSSRMLGIINPIYNEKSCYEADCHVHPKSKKVLGVLDVTFCLKIADETIEKSRLTNIVLAVVSILAFSLLIGFFVERWVDKPVRELVEATNRVAIGNLNQPIKYDGKDELGILAKSFNNMMKKLSEMRVQLFQSDKMASLGRLAAGVAHEINNPLTGVLTYSSFLLKRAKDNPELQKDLEVIVRETKRSREIVKGLLDFSRQSTPKEGKMNVNEVISNAIAVISNQLKLHNITLKKELDDDIPDAAGDANQIQQVVLNLVVNSIDAMGGKGGTLTITSEKISLVPYGVKQIKQATCPKGHNLMDEEHKIDGMPSIKLKAKSSTNEGFIHLDPIYGRHRHHYGIQFKEHEIVKLFCPVCGISVVDEKETGEQCGAPVYKIIIPNQGTLVGCTKYACNCQKWDYIDSKGKQDYIKIKISDTGCGISEENINRIFEPFFSTKGQKGTGLGLSIIWGIIDNHNGKISVESKVNEGTTFTVQLPVNAQV